MFYYCNEKSRDGKEVTTTFAFKLIIVAEWSLKEMYENVIIKNDNSNGEK